MNLLQNETAKPIIPPDLISEIGHTFYHSNNEIVKAHKIPPEMVINLDQTSLLFILVSKYTLEKKVHQEYQFWVQQIIVRSQAPST